MSEIEKTPPHYITERAAAKIDPSSLFKKNTCWEEREEKYDQPVMATGSVQILIQR